MHQYCMKHITHDNAALGTLCVYLSGQTIKAYSSLRRQTRNHDASPREVDAWFTANAQRALGHAMLVRPVAFGRQHEEISFGKMVHAGLGPWRFGLARCCWWLVRPDVKLAGGPKRQRCDGNVFVQALFVVTVVPDAALTVCVSVDQHKVEPVTSRPLHVSFDFQQGRSPGKGRYCGSRVRVADVRVSVPRHLPWQKHLFPKHAEGRCLGRKVLDFVLERTAQAFGSAGLVESRAVVHKSFHVESDDCEQQMDGWSGELRVGLKRVDK